MSFKRQRSAKRFLEAISREIEKTTLEKQAFAEKLARAAAVEVVVLIHTHSIRWWTWMQNYWISSIRSFRRMMVTESVSSRRSAILVLLQALPLVMFVILCLHCAVWLIHRINGFIAILQADYGDIAATFASDFFKIMNEPKNEIVPETDIIIRHVNDIKSVLSLGDKLGGGAQGSVLQARLLSSGEEVAVKVESPVNCEKIDFTVVHDHLHLTHSGNSKRCTR